MPSWLSSGDRAYLRKHIRQSKYDPQLEEVEVLDVNPQYAHVKLPSGFQSTVSIRDLAPCGDTQVRVPLQPSSPQSPMDNQQVIQRFEVLPRVSDSLESHQSIEDMHEEDVEVQRVPDDPVLRRSSRSNIGKAPNRLIEEK